ncbi:SigB/SigF/SigG family RNA polymerase sigma factor [Actinoplanes sp. NPDC051494]|uniref:SigB/SigF/SigG family RNA polymerase sigma factor n=1 Tax=Actinoplanes sp. NPDC051494 TaxID=3363907 RepID=UPI0037896D3F
MAPTVTDDALISRFTTLAPHDPARPAARSQVVGQWLPLARHLARRYAGRGEPLDDLVQVAVLGLLKSVDRYEPDRGDFGAFAVPTIIGEIKRHFRDRTWAVRVPRRLQELRQAISAATCTLTQTLHRSPTVVDVAAYLGISEEDVIEGLEGSRAYRATPLSAPAGPGDARELSELLGADEDGYAQVEARMAIGPALAGLDERERTIVVLRFFGNLTQTQIAEHVGISQMHVSRLITRALETMRDFLET